MLAQTKSEPTFRPRLLIVEDDQRLCGLLKEYLETMGYSVSLAHTGLDGADAARRESFHGVILDVMLPGMDGFEILRQIRADSDVPVLMFTARNDDTDRVVGLEMGADDYLAKTSSMRELLARVRALLRRSMAGSRNGAERRVSAVQVRDLVVDPASHTATLAGQLLELTHHEFVILLALARAAGRVRTREQLLLEAADRDFEGFDRTIDVHISSLRRKLGDDPKSPRWIETVRRVGYLLRRD